MAGKYSQGSLSIPTSSIPRPYKISQIGNSGMKINHLATLVVGLAPGCPTHFEIEK
jgi:hypothetical protein